MAEGSKETTHHFNAAVSFDPRTDFYKQEIPAILAHVQENPDTTLLDATRIHLQYRGLREFENLFRIEHDFAHLYMGLLRHQKADYDDFQIGYHAEVFAIYVEAGIRPADQMHPVTGNPMPERVNVTPEVISSLENEENYFRTLCWLIGAQSRDRAANIRYMNGGLIDGQVAIETHAKRLGYKVSYERDDILKPVTWSVANSSGRELYYGRPGQSPKLPQGHNGVEEFKPFHFADEAEREAFFTKADQLIDFLKARAGDRDVKDILAEVKVTELSEFMREKLAPAVILAAATRAP